MSHIKPLLFTLCYVTAIDLVIYVILKSNVFSRHVPIAKGESG